MNWQKISWLFILCVSISTFAQAQKSYKAKQLYGNWRLHSINEEKIPTESDFLLTFTKNGKVIISESGRKHEASWKMSRKGYFIEVNTPNGPEEWEIKELTKSKLIFVDKSEKITLYKDGKQAKPEKEKAKKIKNPSKFLIGKWKVIRFNSEDMTSEEMFLEIEENGKIQLSYNGTISQQGSWKLNSEENRIIVTEKDDESAENWQIIHLDKENLELLDKSIEIVLIKK